eukprot:c17464_g1_i2.p1 GENE.c17464_g1_i2~~c17464_g1_i2.p1  ORF type:complete len:505 (-),score=157.56 c17464_g1_i2:25-1539(-)
MGEKGNSSPMLLSFTPEEPRRSMNVPQRFAENPMGYDPHIELVSQNSTNKGKAKELNIDVEENVAFSPPFKKAQKPKTKPPGPAISKEQEEFEQNVIKQLKNMKTYRPYFSYITAIIQVIILVASLFPQTGGSLAEWGISTVEKTKLVKTFSNPVNQTVLIAQNLWYGPSTFALLHFGAKYSPCMRSNDFIDVIANNIQKEESSFGCCINNKNECGMMNSTSCYGHKAFYNSSCADVTQCKNATILRPCCYGIEGRCQLLTQDQCDLIEGLWHEDKSQCSGNNGVNCMSKICGIGGFRDSSPDQWWRIFTAIFMHIGVIHLVFNILFQLTVCAEIETFAGPWRTALMYIISGVGGNIIAAIFAPKSVSAGSSGSLYGMIAVSTVETFHSWQILPNRIRQTLRLFIMLVIFLGIGTLPWIDNWAHAGGFVVGIFCGMAFLPYLQFGKWDDRRKKIFKIFSIIMLIVGAVIGMAVFYAAPNPDFCSWCHYVDCVPYTSDLCSSESS